MFHKCNDTVWYFHKKHLSGYFPSEWQIASSRLSQKYDFFWWMTQTCAKVVILLLVNLQAAEFIWCMKGSDVNRIGLKKILCFLLIQQK